MGAYTAAWVTVVAMVAKVSGSDGAREWEAALMVLPIEIVSRKASGPPQFRWRQVVDSPAGKHVVVNEGTVPAPLETALVKLIGITRQLLMDNAVLQGQLDAANARANSAETLNNNQRQMLDEMGLKLKQMPREAAPAVKRNRG